jgi:hypothetical protein
MIGFGFMDNMVMITMGMCVHVSRFSLHISVSVFLSLSLSRSLPSGFRVLGLALMQAVSGRVRAENNLGFRV